MCEALGSIPALKLKKDKKKKTKKPSNKKSSWMLVAHTCNPSYLRSRDQENHSLKPAPGKFL
jgi:hypothetical protein